MAKQQKMVDEDGLKRQARRRLIGAVALVTAVVVLLPMVLDREPRPGGQNIELNIPDKDRAGEFNPPMIAASAPIPAALSVPVASPAPVAAPVAASHVSGTTQSVATVAAPLQHPPAAKVVAEKPAAAQHEAVPEQAAATPPVEVTRVPEQAVAAESFVVQIGAFSKAATAHNLQKKLSKQGIKAYTEKAGDKLRVRAGPYATREAAEKARHKLEAMGLHPILSPAQ